ncbi:hypothetical protein LEP1GSC050_0995 [Leptospira broomii serovar Hurstbridge str. 5399]|uniref:Uncharacterized protein n=1 Tax=Leptospira broomii serovar Hurstbridge str. 5399 TaxID=1049789 RepID=T0FI24_9LEPT|nr:hypothetical protein [Leptospira broomii]EQA47252.1 hypothetical protein LEP1GSC050_0995 [Leptospira broomii serovar Hurstbridge str. 5399]
MSVLKSELPFLEVKKTAQSDPVVSSMVNLREKITDLETKADQLEKRISGSRLDIRV